MKKLLLFISIVFFVACTSTRVSRVEYRLSTQRVVPDSLRSKAANWAIEEAIMTTEMLKDSTGRFADKIANESYRMALLYFGIETNGLKIIDEKETRFVPYYKFTKKEKKIYESLRKHKP